MTYAYVLVPILALLLGGVGGYFVGRYQVALLNKIRTLEGQSRELPPEPEKPTVLMGAYEPPREISSVPDKRAAGLVEAKTPELVEWESKQAVNKEVLGH
jgi:hypothetical protein